MVLKNLFVRQEIENGHREQSPGHSGGKERVGWIEKVALKTYALPYVKRIAGGKLCITQGPQPSALQQPGGLGWGESWEGGSRQGTYVYWHLIHIVVRQKLTQHCKAITLQLKIIFKEKHSSRPHNFKGASNPEVPWTVFTPHLESEVTRCPFPAWC